MRYYRKIALVVVLGVLLGVLLPAQALGQTGNGGAVHISAKGGFGDDGSFVMGRWFPIRVTLDNPANGRDMRVRVEVNILGNDPNVAAATGVYARDVDLPASSHKEVTLYSSANTYVHSLDVRLLEGSTLLATAGVPLNPLDPSSTGIVGVVSSDSSLLNAYKDEPLGHPESAPVANNYGNYGNYGPGSQSGTSSGLQSVHAQIEHIAPGDIPAVSYALGGVGALVLDDVDTGALSQEQRDALASWVAQGGTLVLSSRPGGADTLGGLSDLSPVTASGTSSLTSLQGLAGLVATPITPTGQIIVPDARLRTEPIVGAYLLAGQDGVPLVAMRDLGSGQVAYLAVSPGVDPVKNWDGAAPLMRRILAEHRLNGAVMSTQNSQGGFVSTGGGSSVSVVVGQGGQLFNMYGSLFDLPGLNLPEPLVIALFMLVYIILVGPVTYFVLKRLRRQELAWLTIPVTVVIFSVAAYVIGYQSKGGDVVVIRGSIVHTEEGANAAQAQEYLGIFSPQRHTYSLQIDADSLAGELNSYGYGNAGSSNPATVLGGASTTIDGVNVNTWDMRRFVAEATFPAPSPLETDLHLGDNKIEGTVRNRGSDALQDVALLRGGATQYIGYLAPGQSAPVRLELSSTAFAAGSPTTFLPLPAGVQDPTSNSGVYYPNYYSNGNGTTDAQRQYNRRVVLLDTALSAIVTDQPADDMSVLSVAWTPQPAGDFRVVNASARNEDVSVWTGRHPVLGSNSASAKLDAGRTPFDAYVPSANPAWNTPISATLSISPYADLIYRLPAGAQPQKLALTYSVGAGGSVDVKALNQRTGSWDTLFSLNAGAQPGKTNFTLPSPGDYTAPGGEVMLRLAPSSGSTTSTVTFGSFDLLLNEGP